MTLHMSILFRCIVSVSRLANVVRGRDVSQLSSSDWGTGLRDKNNNMYVSVYSHVLMLIWLCSNTDVQVVTKV
jgi:hypothetical protein